MQQADRTRLLRVLTAHVGRVAADLRAQMLADGPVQDRARRVHTDEKVGDDYAVWTDLLSRRAAVMWVLKSVYARVLEDRGLLSPGRLLDPEAQQLFEKLAPNLGETAFLRWVWRDLAVSPGGLPELFAPQPAEVAVPSDALSRELIEIWRKVDPDTGARWSFAHEKFDGELMGDLYQELDPVVKDRFALCQTPDFVRAFILDRTLTPAIEEYGADVVRLIDPACGSGHFLIDGLRRLVVATGAQHPDWGRRKLVEHALKRVVGTDLNDYACALARARLIMTAADLAGVDSLREASAFHPHVYWADGLEQVERDEAPKPQQTGLFTQGEEPPPRATLTRFEVRETLRGVLKGGFHAVVANPPYIVESDENRKAYHREKVGRKQRYVSAYRQYSLGSPFTERCFQLAVKAGYVGIITSNNFMKREFGKPLVEQVLAAMDLTLVVDTSQAYIPFHGTPTILLFGRHSAPRSGSVRAVMGKRGETGTPPDAARGKVWTSILDGWESVGWENEYVSVADVTRQTLGNHPWSLGGGGAADLKARLDTAASGCLGSMVLSIGRVAHTGADEAYVADRHVLRRIGLPDEKVAVFVEGDKLRDWALSSPTSIAFPYDSGLQQVAESWSEPVIRWLWRFRQLLWERREPQGTHREIGFTWHQFSRFHPERFSGKGIAFAFVATHNHFVLDRGGKVFNRSAPVIKLPASATEDDHYALLGVLNSSTACFWMKQISHDKGGGTDSGKMQSDPAKVAFEFSATGVAQLPLPTVPPAARTELVTLARALDELAQHRSRLLVEVLPDHATDTPPTGRALLDQILRTEVEDAALLARMIALQEEMDWRGYELYGLLKEVPKFDGLIALPLGCRPFEVRDARAGRAVGVDGQRLQTEFPEDLPANIRSVLEKRCAASAAEPLRHIENERYKRRWVNTPKDLAGRVETFQHRVARRVESVLRGRVEHGVSLFTQPVSTERIAAGLQADAWLVALAEVHTGRRDFSIDTLVADLVRGDSVPNHSFHVYTVSGLTKRAAWERTWADQTREDAGEAIVPERPPEYGKEDFLRIEYFEQRRKLDVPKERFIAFTEVPGGGPTLYGWAGWTPLQRLKALLALDEKLEDAGHPIGDRIGVLDSAWRLLPDVAREDTTAAARLKAELSSLVGKDGPSPEMLAAWKAKFPPPGAGRGRKKAP
jgi:hypothetical protein